MNTDIVSLHDMETRIFGKSSKGHVLGLPSKKKGCEVLEDED
jgi:hypothetical protein